MEKGVTLIIVSICSLAVGLQDRPEYKRTPLGDSIDLASMKFFKEVYEQSGEGNLIVSPLGVFTLLSLHASGSDGPIRDEIVNLLGNSDFQHLSESYRNISERFGKMDSSFLTLANKMFVSNKVYLKDDFVKAARSFRSEVDNIDFSDRESAAQIMNDWASTKTNGKINNVMRKSDIDPATVLALLNVIHFQGHWHVPFNTSETRMKYFYPTNTRRVRKPMMHLMQPLHYHYDKEMRAKMIELPYKESKFRMIVVLPDDVDGLSDVVQKVAEKGLLGDIFQMLPTWDDVDLDLPKFEINSKHNLKDILPKIGVSSMFQKEANGIVNNARGVVVDKASQEAYITVNEEGASAGALTGTGYMYLMGGLQLTIPFKANKPFLFAVLHDDVILFVGTYVK